MDNQKMTPETEQAKKKDRLWEFFSNVELLAVAAAAILLFFSLVARITVVEGGSMEDTLIGGDKLIVSDLFYTPERGDIVIVHSPTVNNGKAIVKRVVAVGGDTVAVRQDGIYVNGVLLNETDGSLGYTVDPMRYYAQPELTLGEGEVYVLGDNRHVSYDSRAFGPIDERAIIGKVIFRFAPLSSFGSVN